ncbi:MAG: Hsp70 family protein [Deltaproteobacteria bacterium]|nr:Hsp70 family protein [Deltaproteobacteria bacterium]
MAGPLYVGIDLGTTNSTAAAFDGTTLTVVRNAAGSTLTPSVVRFSSKGTATVGEKARRFLESDPENTRSGFKRLMGTDTKLHFAAAGRDVRPEELSAEVLRALIHDVDVQMGVRPQRAIITVPALFELPQTRATAESARMAGFERVEILQEPVASALAAGFKSGSDGTWLVYDLGGGTFDVSLLQGKDGILRVIGHDGDNFLGGRDFDQAIVAWAIEMLQADGLAIDPKNPTHQPFLRRLAAIAEEAKIELGRQAEVTLSAGEPLTLGDEEIELELTLTRAVLERLVEPLVVRSCEVCERLLTAHNVERADLEHVVLVGGPTAMGFVRGLVAERVGPLAAEAHDPMTLVAQGAALAAAASGLDARPTTLTKKVEVGHRLIVKAPTLSTDLMPFVLAKVVDTAAAGAPRQLRLVRRADKEGEPAWASEWVVRDDEGAFAVMAELIARKGNTFTLEGKDVEGNSTAVSPSSLSIVHGVTIGDPPVSRSVGVALANNMVRVYFEKGAPLPTKRTFTHHTIETTLPGSPGPALRVPLVQGEMEEAHLCRLIGSLEIDGKELDQVLPANTAVEVTLELDKGGQLSAKAYIPSLKKVFESVAHLVVPEASLDALRSGVVQLLDRLARLRADAKRNGAVGMFDRIDGMLRDQQEAERALDRAMGGDEEQAQRARRLMLDLEGKVAELEAEGRWPELEGRALDDVAWAAGLVGMDGTPAEKKLLDDAIGGINRARQSRSVKDLERHRRVVRRLANAAFFRDPQAWVTVFDNLQSHVHEARDLKRAEALVDQGRKLVAKGDAAALRGVCDQLSELMPVSAQERARAFSSGLR